MKSSIKNRKATSSKKKSSEDSTIQPSNPPATEQSNSPIIKIRSTNQFPVIGIGASAGGLDAFKKLLKAIPEDSGMAYVLVQHLDPKHESLLPELLQKVTHLPVMEITDDIKVQPGHIYVIPSNKMMVATDGVLLLAPRPAKGKNERNLPIDLFFRSLAEVHQSQAIGVILSGTASDGTLGLKAIKDHGGITFAQDEASAEYSGMPHSAAQAGVVDFILPPEEIPRKLLEVTSKTALSDEDLQNITKQDGNVFKQILSLLRIRKGVDFTYYKQTTVHRRILRRMLLHKSEESADYLKFLRGNKQEQDLLYQDMLIPVTSFFRDKKVFEDLCNHVFPTILKNKLPGEITRIWVAGCSTGQEVYSFAICFNEFLGDNQERIQIFGTDLSESAIAKARTGLYEKSELDAISPQRLQEFFTKNNGGYQVNKSIRDRCVFAHHNFLKDPPFGKMDCISCRNVLIYMEPFLQKKALTTFHYALNPKGFLLLGKSETTGCVPDLFGAEAKNDKLYTRKDVTGGFMQVASRRSEQILNRSHDRSRSEPIRYDFQKTADDILLTKYTPAGVVVNEIMDIVHFRGNTANYLQQAPGKPTHNLLMMAKNGLGFELRNILHKAKADKAPVVKENIPLSVNGNLRNISIEAVPLPNTLEPYYLVLFHDNNLNDSYGSALSNKKKVSAKTKKDEKDIHILLLEQELAQAREDMRSITEDQEASNEKLQSANEELLSGSEELQSLNEELETSKEELQSTNEELTVLNHELVGLNEQVTDARNYSESIVATINQPLLVLDKNLRVKTANKAFYKTFKLNEQETEGMLIYDLDNRQWNISLLRTLLEEILPQKTAFTNFEVTHNFSSVDERVILFSALEIAREKKEEKLILLTIEDVTEQRDFQLKEKKILGRYYSLLLQTPVPIVICRGSNYIVELINDLALGMLIKDKGIIGKALFEAMPELEIQLKSVFDEVMHTGIPFHANEYEISLFRSGRNEPAYFNLVLEPIREEDNTVSAIITAAIEITDQVVARKKVEVRNQLFGDMLMTAPGFVATLRGPDHVYELVNKQYQSLFGKREIQGKPIMMALPELEGQGFDTLLDKVYNTGETYVGIEIPITLARDEGLAPELRYFNFSYQPMYDEHKSIFSVLVFGYEVTAQVIAKKKIEESEHRYHEMIYSSPSMMAIFKGDDMIIKIANDSILDAWGKGKEVIGMPLLSVMPELIEQGFGDLLHQVYSTGKPHYANESPIYVMRNGKMVLSYYTFIYQAQRDMHGEIIGVAVIGSEVTPQALLNKKIKTSEERYHNLINFSPSAIGILQGEDLVITTANNAIMEIWGKGKAVFGKKYFDLLPELAEQGYREVFSEVYKTGNPFNAIETPVSILQDGKMELKYYNFLLQAQRNVNGEIDGVGIIANEVTTQAVLNLKIKASEEQFRLLVEQAPVAICVLRGENYVIEIINEGMIEMWDRTMKEAIDKPAFEVLPELKEQGFKELLDNVYRTGERFVAEEIPINLRRNGKLESAFVKFVYEPLREADGTVTGVMALAHEITEQVLARKKIEESEAHFRLLSDMMPAKISNADAAGNVTYFNKPWMEFSGLNFEELRDFGYHKMIHPDEAEEFQSRFQEAAATGTVLEMEMRFLDKEGNYKWHLNLAAPVKDEAGNILMWVGVTTEIQQQKEQKEELKNAVQERTSELQEANETLYQKNEELNQMNKELEAFTYISSHDLQEPLRKIQTFAGRILEKENQNLSGNGKDMFKRMREESERMRTLIKDLLAFSRLGTTERKFETVSLNIIIEEAKTEFKEALAEKHAIIEVKEICEVRIIPFQFHQLMHNLIGNALKFSKADVPPHITISSRNIRSNKPDNIQLRANKAYCQISISDNGIGFESEYSQKIFEVFQRLHAKAEYAGTGIGLAIVKKVIDNHNGVIIATSELGKGARFDIYIPA